MDVITNTFVFTSNDVNSSILKTDLVYNPTASLVYVAQILNKTDLLMTEIPCSVSGLAITY